MNCLFTLNICNKQGFNGPFITDRVRRSFVAACLRWGCNYAEINHEPGFEGAKICNWGKLLGPKYLVGYDKLLYLDGDMIISEHAPNPFDLCVKEDVMYAVTDAQGNNPNETWFHCIYGAEVGKITARFPTFSQPQPERYFNSGFMLFYNTPKIRETFDEILANRDLEAPTCYDQTVINMFVHNRMWVELLPTEWNYIVWGRPASDTAHINHFAHAGPSLA